VLSPTNPREGESLASFLLNRCREPEPRNSNVLNILPVTTLRTIDLGGKENSDPLLSRFCEELSGFSKGNSAPERVHSRVPGSDTWAGLKKETGLGEDDRPLSSGLFYAVIRDSKATRVGEGEVLQSDGVSGNCRRC